MLWIQSRVDYNTQTTPDPNYNSTATASTVKPSTSFKGVWIFQSLNTTWFNNINTYLEANHPSSGVHNSNGSNHISFLVLFIFSFLFHSKTIFKTCLCCFLLFQSVELVCLLILFDSFIWFAFLVVIIEFLVVLIGAIVFFFVLIGSYVQKWVSMRV